MLPDLSIQVSTAQGQVPITVFHIKGDIDGKTSAQLISQAEASVNDGTRNLLLDLTQVPYISSAGLRALHQIYTLLRSKSTSEGSNAAIQKGLADGTYRACHLKLLNPSKAVAHVLQMAGFDMYIEMYTNRKEALDSF